MTRLYDTHDYHHHTESGFSAASSNVCLDCGQPLNIINHQNGRATAECKNKSCDMLDITLPLEELQTLTEEAREQFRGMTRTFRARQAKIAAEVEARNKTAPRVMG